MSAKLVIVGGLVFFVTALVVKFGTGIVIHEGVLKPAYQDTASFWHPELRSEPPDMAALMPLWIGHGILFGLVMAGLYGCVRPALSGPGWRRGLVFALGAWVLAAVIYVGMETVFDLPATIWAWWIVDYLIVTLPAGVALGWVAQKMTPVA